MPEQPEKSAAQTFYESHEPATLTTICGGAASEVFDAELRRVIENALDINTDTKGKREVTLKLTVTPNPERTAVALELSCASKIAGSSAVSGVVYMGKTRHGEIRTAVHKDPISPDMFEDEPTPPRAVVAEGPATSAAPAKKTRVAQ